MRVCFVDRANLNAHRKPQTVAFPALSTERAELEHFAEAIKAKKRLAVAGGDEAHGVAVLEAVLESTKRNATVTLT